MNPIWVAAVTKAVGERGHAAWKTQQYTNKVLREIGEQRSKAEAENRYEKWLFITGQDEYKNPFTGKAELGTNAYRYRWVCEDGRILYTNENSLDPNNTEEYKTRTWKRSPVQPR